MTLGAGGVKTDILTGDPLQHQRKTPDDIENELQEARRLRNTLELELQQEGGYVVETLKEVVIAHCETVLAQDRVYQMFLKFLAELGHKLSVAPILAERQIARHLPSYKGKPPAPFGIPGK